MPSYSVVELIWYLMSNVLEVSLLISLFSSLQIPVVNFFSFELMSENRVSCTVYISF